MKELARKNDKASHRELKQLSRLPCNSTCADCDAMYPGWAALPHGIFLCIDCAQVHRAMGTHVSRVKNCLGTYLWHPDEMAAMRAGGNRWAADAYECGPVLDRDSRHYSQEEAIPILLEKYASGPKKISRKKAVRKGGSSTKSHSTKSHSVSASKIKVKGKSKSKHTGKKNRAATVKRLIHPPGEPTLEEEKTPAASAQGKAASDTLEIDFFEAMLSTPAPGVEQGILFEDSLAPMNFEEWSNF
jgi:hypothetical protein